jgi:hypothetical protein
LDLRLEWAALGQVRLLAWSARGRAVSRLALADRLAAVTTPDAGESRVQQSLKLPCGAAVGLSPGGGVVGDRERRLTGEVRLHHAPPVGATALVSVHIAKVDLDPGELVGEPGQQGGYLFAHLLQQVSVGVDVSVGADLNVHRGVLLQSVVSRRLEVLRGRW